MYPSSQHYICDTQFHAYIQYALVRSVRLTVWLPLALLIWTEVIYWSLADREPQGGRASRDGQVHRAFGIKRNSTDVAFERVAFIQLYPCTVECANRIAYLKGTLDTPQVNLFSLHCMTS